MMIIFRSTAGKKMKNRNISSIFKGLDTKHIDKLEHYYISNMPSIDALRVILYKYSLSILFYKERIVLHNNDEDLHQFRVNIRKSRALLKEFEFLFPKELYTYFNEYLSMFATQTNKKRDLDVIGERLEQLDEKHGSIQKNIREQQLSEHQHIEAMLKGQTFINFF